MRALLRSAGGASRRNTPACARRRDWPGSAGWGYPCPPSGGGGIPLSFRPPVRRFRPVARGQVFATGPKETRKPPPKQWRRRRHGLQFRMHLGGARHECRRRPPVGKHYWLHLHEEGGKHHEVPCYYQARAYLVYCSYRPAGVIHFFGGALSLVRYTSSRNKTTFPLPLCSRSTTHKNGHTDPERSAPVRSIWWRVQSGASLSHPDS